VSARYRLVSALLAVAVALTARAEAQSVNADTRENATVVLDNDRVRVFKADGAALAGVEHRPGVVVRLEDGSATKAGDAYWASDAAIPRTESGDAGPLVIVQPKDVGSPAPAANTGSKPGGATFVGMSFVPMFENEKVAVIRARMDVDAREGFHTHATDVLVIHLSGGAIEDTANGTTKVNRWKPGDIEFEARGSSHSARNLGDAIDVVLVTFKP
jgi:quercetin dioxygenase-like cupin family protein